MKTKLNYLEIINADININNDDIQKIAKNLKILNGKIKR